MIVYLLLFYLFIFFWSLIKMFFVTVFYWFQLLFLISSFPPRIDYLWSFFEALKDISIFFDNQIKYYDHKEITLYLNHRCKKMKP